VTLDQKYRIVLDRKTRDVAGLKKGDRLVAVPFKGGVILVATKGHKFEGSLASFNFVEEKHEASRYIFRRKP
jgi:bifunctional DNA-binding transcriptional regulator/antitoxin component of YhaV-PrlF toxin-antitoxin module